MASSFETHRCAMLLRTRSTLMVRSAPSRVSNHVASGEATMIRVNLKTLWQPSPIAAGRFSGAVSRITATAAGPTCGKQHAAGRRQCVADDIGSIPWH